MFKMKFNSFKNFVILVLVVAAVYQTGQLWLGSSPSHNFFYSFGTFSGKSSDQNDALRVSVDPKTIVVGYNSDSFYLFYGKLNEMEIKTAADEFIQNVLENPTDYHTEELDYNAYLNNRCVVYDFSFDVRAKEYFYGLATEIIGEDMDFNCIIAVPSSSADEENKIYIIDDKTQKALIIESMEARDGNLVSAINNVREEQVGNADGFTYISTAKYNLKVYKGSQFLAQWKRNDYAPLIKTPVLDTTMTADSFDSELEAVAKPFFDNYAGVVFSEDEEVYSLRTKTTMIQYNPMGVLEYYNHEQKDGSQSLSTAYYACKEFLKKDTTLNTDIYLADVSWVSGELVFSFDYCVNDLPVFMDDGIKEAVDSDYAINVSVENNKVKSYKRYFYNYSIDSSEETKTETAANNFLYAYNQTLSDFGKEGDIQIEELILGYYDTAGESGGNLVWRTQVEGTKRYIDTKEEIQEQ